MSSVSTAVHSTKLLIALSTVLVSLVHQLTTLTKFFVVTTSLVGVPYTAQLCRWLSDSRTEELCGKESEGKDFKLRQPTTLLMDCPAMSLWAYEGGVALIPSAPPGVLLLWLPHQSPQLQVLVLA